MYSSKNSEYVANSIKRRRTNLKKVFHSKCCLCGFNAIPEALEFHHVNPAEKSFGISSGDAVTKSLNSQLEEMKKWPQCSISLLQVYLPHLKNTNSSTNTKSKNQEQLQM